MNIKEFKKLVNSIPDEYDDSEVYMRFANGDYDNRHYTISSVIPMAILGCSGTNHLAISCTIVKYMEANSLNTLFAGKNVGWKDSINLGRTNNQNFVSIPYNMLIQMLEYKCKLAGINIVIKNSILISLIY